MALLPKPLVKKGAEFIAENLGSTKTVIKGGNNLGSTPEDFFRIKGGNDLGTSKEDFFRIKEGNDLSATEEDFFRITGGNRLGGAKVEKQVIKGGANLGSTKVKKVLKDPKPMKFTTDNDVIIGEVLTKLRFDVVGDELVRADIRVMQNNYDALTKKEKAIAKEALDSLKPGRTINDLIKLGNKKRAALLAAAGGSGVANADETQKEQESRVLTEFEAFKAEEATPEPVDAKNAFVLSRMRQGQGIAQIRAFLTEKQVPVEDIDSAIMGAGQELRDRALIGGQPLAGTIDRLGAMGYSEEQVSFITGQPTDVPLLPPEDGVIREASQIPTAPQSIEDQSEALDNLIQTTAVDPETIDLADIQAQVNSIYEKPSELFTEVQVIFGDKAAMWQAQIANVELANKTSAIMNKFGAETRVAVDNTSARPGVQIEVKNKAGEFVPLDLPIYDEIVAGVIANRINIAGAVVAGEAGLLAAQALVPPVAKAIPYVGWLAKPIAGVIGGALAAGYAAYEGTGADIARNALALQIQVSDNLIKAQMAENGLMEAGFGGAIGTAQVVVVGGVKFAARIYRFIASGNDEAAFAALKTRVGAGSDEAIQEMIDEVRTTVNLVPIKGEDIASTALRVLPQTDPRLAQVVGIAAKHKPISSVDLTKQIDTRAKEVINATSNPAAKNAGTVVVDELSKYVTTVKENFKAVKGYAIQEIDKSGTYTFDYGKTAIQPFLSKMQKQITNPRSAETLGRVISKMESLGAYEVKSSVTRPVGSVQGETVTRPIDAEFLGKSSSEVAIPGTPGVDVQAEEVLGATRSTVTTNTTPANIEANSLRSFSNLLELRVEINQMRSTPAFKNAAAKNGVDAVMSSIDSEIAKMAKTMPEGKEWMKLWKATNQEYSKYKQVANNVLFKAMTKPGVDNQQIIEALSRNIGAIDNTFMEVVEKLPASTRIVVEDSVLSNFVGKYTVGDPNGFQAIHYPELSKKLDTMTFSTPKAKVMKDVIQKLAIVFKADPQLGAATDNITTTAFQTAFTADPVVRAKMQVAKSVTNYVKRYLPGESGKAAALVTNVARLMKDPLKVDNIEEMIKKMPKDAELADILKELRISATQFSSDARPVVEVYSSFTKPLDKTEGPLGKGVYFKGTEEFFKGSVKNRLESISIRPERIATEKDIRGLIKGRDNATIEELLADPLTARQLEEMGYIGIGLGEDVMLF